MAPSEARCEFRLCKAVSTKVIADRALFVKRILNDDGRRAWK